jgi:signal transduction histidine kinase
MCRVRLRHNSIELKTNVNDLPQDLSVECRAAQVSQVIINLLNNSSDAIRDLKSRWISLDISESPDTIQISVTDSGASISPEIVKKLMTPFFTTKAAGNGTGIGLSVSKAIIEAHKGRFYFDSTTPNTRFVIEIPRNQSIPSNFQTAA